MKTLINTRHIIYIHVGGCEVVMELINGTTRKVLHNTPAEAEEYVKSICKSEWAVI